MAGKIFDKLSRKNLPGLVIVCFKN